MAHVLLFHHAQGLTPGLRSFADELRSAGHEVTTPDLYDGRTFPTVEQGVAHAKSLGFQDLLGTGIAAAGDLPTDLVYVGFSLGCLPAQALSQQRPGAQGCLLFHGAAPLDEFGGTWPDGLRAQIHIAEHDPWEDLDFIRSTADEIGAELFVYDGEGHLFLDSSVPDFQPEAARLATDRVLSFLSEVDDGR